MINRKHVFLSVRIALVMCGVAGCGDPSETSACYFTSIGAKAEGTVGVAKHGSLWSWGKEYSGAFSLPERTPHLVRSSTEIVAVASRAWQVCEWHLNRSWVCWGEELGTRELSGAKQLAVGTDGHINFAYNPACILFEDGSVTCWKALEGGYAMYVPPGLPPGVFDLALGDVVNEEGCAVTQDHVLWCWGAGIIGDGQETRTEIVSATPLSFLGPTVTRVALSRGSKCLISDDGAVLCWGPLLDPGSPQLIPTVVDVMEAATALVMGDDHACALVGTGRVICWGDNSLGQTSGREPGDRTPQQVPLGGRKAVELAAGAHHTCARLTDGSVFCWGDNGNGQLGNAAFVEPSSRMPVQVQGCP